MVIRCAEEDTPVAYSHATILLAVSRDLAEVEVVLPNDAAAGSVEREDPRVGSGEIDDAVDHDGSGLQPIFVITGLENPGRRERHDIGSVDLVEGAIAQSGIRASVARPI